MRAFVHAPEPFSCKRFHLIHMFLIRTKKDVLTVFLCHVFFKDLIQSVCLFQSTSQLFKQFFVFSHKALIGQIFYFLFQLL